MEDRVPLFSATKKDFKLDWFSGSGAGGQHRNKHQNCLRLTHIPTGLMAVSQTERDRPSNLRNAFRVLAKKVVAHWLGDQRKARFGAGDETIRTYHEPDNRVTDHASGKQSRYSAVINKADIGEMVDARRYALAAKLAETER